MVASSSASTAGGDFAAAAAAVGEFGQSDFVHVSGRKRRAAQVGAARRINIMQKGVATVAQLSGFDEIIDARTPAEFAEDHIPGAINLPVLDNDERIVVGTMYKQQSAFDARRLGGALVAANISRHMLATLQDKPKNWRPSSTAGAAASAAAPSPPGCAWWAGTPASSRAATRPSATW